MKIALYGAGGVIESRIAAEALSRGHQVTGITRSGVAAQGVTARVGDLADPRDVAEVAAEHDVVVSATGPSRTGGSHDAWLSAVQALLDSVGTTRVVFVGGAGSL